VKQAAAILRGDRQARKHLSLLGTVESRFVVVAMSPKERIG
jgi:hypothetical protein